MTRDAIQHARYRNHQRPAMKEAAAHLRDLEKLLRAIDPSWRPGAALDLGPEERKLLPFIRHDIEVQIINALYRARHVAAAAVTEIRPLAEELLKLASGFMLTAWRTRRRLRMQKSASIADYGYRDFEVLVLQEMNALRKVGQSMMDAGSHIEGSAVCHLLLQVIPAYCLDDKRFQRVGDDLAHYIRKIGLEVPALFERRRPEAPSNEVTNDEDAVVAPRAGGAGTGVVLAGEPRRAKEANPRDIRVAHDMTHDERWRLIAERSGNTGKDALQCVANDAGKGIQDTDVLRAAFGLALKYGEIRMAEHLLHYCDPTQDDLIEFARSIGAVRRLEPLGLDMEAHLKWQSTLRGRLARQATSEISPDKALALHEVLLGHYLQVVRSSGPEGARLIAQKHYDLLDDVEMSAIWAARDIPAAARGSKIVTPEVFRKFLKHTSGGALGIPLCVSVVELDPSSWSLLLTGPEDHWIHRTVQIPGLSDAAREVERFSWFTPTGRLQVPWNKVRGLWEEIARLSEELTTSPRWILLAIEPRIAALPWQDLVTRIFGRDTVLSLVPSFGWTKIAYERVGHGSQGVVTRLSDDADLADLRRQISEDTDAWQRSLGVSAAVVLGHGTWGDDHVPAIVAPSVPIGLRDWMDLANRKVTIVHSCHGGRVRRTLLGDLGGLPGLLLGLGGRVICAPVSEVSPRSAAILQRCLAATEGSIGLNYLTALQEDPAIALYTLYGFADEPVPSGVQVAG